LPTVKKSAAVMAPAIKLNPAAHGAALKRVMHLAWSAARLALKGSSSAERRK
jgi:hypothetical protein